MLKLKLQYFGHLMWRADSLEKTLMLGKTLENPLDSKEIKPVNPKGNPPWIFIRRTDAEAEAEAPTLGPPDAKIQFTGKDPDAGKDRRWEEKRGNRGWDSWIASLIQWTWVWANSRKYWRTGKLDALQSMESWRVRHDLVTPCTVAYQAPLFMGSSRQENWSGLPFPSPGDHPNLGLEPGSPALQADSLPSELQGWSGTKATSVQETRRKVRDPR